MVTDGDLGRLRDCLQQEGFTIRAYHRADEGRIGQIRASKQDVAYDFNLISVEYEAEAIARAQSNDGILVVEDLLIQKLFAWRDRDRDDVRTILATHPDLDMAIFDRWVGYFDIGDRLRAELKRAI